MAVSLVAPKGTSAIHPAQYSKQLLQVLADAIVATGETGMWFDNFAGLGWRLGEIGELAGVVVSGCEIEPGYFDDGKVAPWVFLGDATDLPFPDNSLRGIVTSVTYGNGMNDDFRRGPSNLNPKTGLPWKYNTYASRLRDVHGEQYTMAENNTGRFGIRGGIDKYKDLSERAIIEAKRVLDRGGYKIVNTKGVWYTKGKGNELFWDCTGWHVDTMIKHGFEVVDAVQVECPGLRHGANRKRVEHEDVTTFRLAA
jgi:hypothetical protein